MGMQSMSRREMLRRTSVSAIGVTAFGIIGCGSGGGGSASQQIRMTWWGDPTRQKLMQKAVDLYTAQNAGVTITREATPWSGYWNKLATQMAARSAADWVMMDQSYLGEYAERHALADLDPLVGKALDLSGMPKALVDSARIDGKLYVVPLALNSQILLYSVTALRKLDVQPPTGDLSWEDFAAFTRKVATASRGKLAGSANMGWDTGTFEVWLRGQGKELYAPDGKSLGFSEADLSAWWSYWLDLQKAGAVVKPDIQAAANAGTAADDVMVKGHAATNFNWSPAWQSLEQLTKDQISGRMLPLGPNGTGQFVKPACYFCSPASSKKVELAAKVATFMVNDIGAAKALGLILGVPVSTKTQRTVAATVTGSGKKTVDYVAEVQQRAKPQTRPWPKGAGQVGQALNRAYQDVSFGRAKVQDAAGRMIQEGNQALQQ
jgi:multiple sugar transport system substrate-binding protein